MSDKDFGWLVLAAWAYVLLYAFELYMRYRG